MRKQNIWTRFLLVLSIVNLIAVLTNPPFYPTWARMSVSVATLIGLIPCFKWEWFKKKERPITQTELNRWISFAEDTITELEETYPGIYFSVKIKGVTENWNVKIEVHGSHSETGCGFELPFELSRPDAIFVIETIVREWMVKEGKVAK